MLSFPNAKINIGLNIIEKRPDGYHNLESVFYPIPVKDGLEFVVNDKLTQPYHLHNSGINVDAPSEENICVKALMLIKEEFNIPNLDIFLHKAIPFGAGLGGGSADAAFMLNMLNSNFELGLSNNELSRLASKLGADCRFFIDNKPAYATGIGDQLEFLPISLSAYYLYLVKPPIHVSTPDAYKGVIASPPDRILKDDILRPVEEWKDIIKNDFEKSVFKKYTEIEDIKNKLYDEGALYAAMSGSGSAVFGLFSHPIHIEFDTSYFTWSGKLK